MKVFFPRRIDGKFCPCPFVGFRANSPEEFKEILKTRFYNKETGYPGLFIETKNKDLVLVFAGHRYEHPEGKPFCLFDRKTDNYPHNWFSIKESDDWFDLLEDAEVIDKKIAVLDRIIKSQGELTIQIK